MIIAAGPPLIAILLALGTLGWLDFRLNTFLNVMTPLIMVISFSDSMQLTFAARDRCSRARLKRGVAQSIAGRRSGLRFNPCDGGAVLRRVAFSDSEMIRSFGEAGIIATLIALITILLLTPLLGVLVLRDEAAFVARIKRHDFGVDVCVGSAPSIALRMVSGRGSTVSWV